MNVGADEGEKLRNTYSVRMSQKGDLTPETVIGLLVVGGRICELLVQLGAMLAIIARETRYLRMTTLGEIEKIKAEEEGRPKIILPFDA